MFNSLHRVIIIPLGRNSSCDHRRKSSQVRKNYAGSRSALLDNKLVFPEQSCDAITHNSLSGVNFPLSHTYNSRSMQKGVSMGNAKTREDLKTLTHDVQMHIGLSGIVAR